MPFITPTLPPEAIAPVVRPLTPQEIQRVTADLLNKLTPDQVARCDRAGRRGSAKWREMARSMQRRPKTARS